MVCRIEGGAELERLWCGVLVETVLEDCKAEIV
jgi:hypothetical protein